MFQLFRVIFRLILGEGVCVCVCVYIYIYCTAIKDELSFTIRSLKNRRYNKT